jgi:lipopolysaccharide biosynthesis glycosyltransferase
MTRIHIACAADEAYAPYCAAMLHSLLESQAGTPLAIHFLHGPQLSPLALQRLRQMVEAWPQAAFLPHLVTDAQLAQVPIDDYFGPAMWYRLLLPELLPDQPRVLYLDVDTLIVDRLDELWQMPLEGYSLAAIDSVVDPRLHQRIATLGLAPGARYFNSGVLLLNLQRLRETRASQRLMTLARSRGAEFLWPDQDALNLVLGAERASVHPRWNCQNTVYYWRHLAAAVFGATAAAEARARPAILHFEGPDMAKPWHYLNTHPARRQWQRHLQQTPFPPPPVKGRDAAAILLRLLPSPMIPYMLRAGRKLRRLLRR